MKNNQKNIYTLAKECPFRQALDTLKGRLKFKEQERPVENIPILAPIIKVVTQWGKKHLERKTKLTVAE